jgi:Zn-dependent protease with chaperone function
MTMRLMLGLVMSGLVACTSVPRLAARPPTSDETRRFAEALTPLLQELDYGIPRSDDDCRIGLAVFDSPLLNASIAGGRAGTPCTVFSVGVTQGMLRRLSVSMLRAVLAHELGHLLLGHIEARAERGVTSTIFPAVSRAFDRRQEAEADSFAVDLLRRLEPRYPDACVALVYVFAMLGEPTGARWLADHPSPDRRAETAMEACNRKS